MWDDRLSGAIRFSESVDDVERSVDWAVQCWVSRAPQLSQGRDGFGFVEVGSVLMIKGMKWLPNIIRGLERFMDEHGYGDIASMHGIASDRAATDYSDQFARSRIHAKVNDQTCQNPTCNVCIQMCFYEALSQNPAGKIDVHADKCIGCELCLDVCPFDSISMGPTTEENYKEGYFAIPEDIYEDPEKFGTQRNNMEKIEQNTPKVAAE